MASVSEGMRTHFLRYSTSWFVSRVIALLITPVYLAKIGMAEYGAFNVYLGLRAVLGLSNTFAGDWFFFGPGFKDLKLEDRSRYLFASFAIGLVLTAIGVIIFSLLILNDSLASRLFAPEERALYLRFLPFLAFEPLLCPMTQLFSTVRVVLGQSKASLRIELTSVLFQVAVALGAIYVWELGGLGLAVAFVLSQFLGAGLSLGYLDSRPTPTAQWAVYRSLLSFGVSSFSKNLGTLLLRKLDAIVINRYVGAAAAGGYGIANRIFSIATEGQNIFFKSYLAKASSDFRQLQSKDVPAVTKHSWIRLSVVLCAGGFSSLCVALGWLPLAFLSGNQADRLHEYALWGLSFQFYFALAVNQGGVFLLISGSGTRLTVPVLCSGLLNLVLMMILTPQFGMLGTLAAGAFSSAVEGFWLKWLAERITGIRLKSYLDWVTVVGSVALLAQMGLRYLFAEVSTTSAIQAVLTLPWLICAWRALSGLREGKQL